MPGHLGPASSLMEGLMNTTTTPRVLTVTTDSFDLSHTFALSVNVISGRPPRRITCTLRQGYQKSDDGRYWAMQKSAVIKSEYTQDELAAHARLLSDTPVSNGDLVEIAGNAYRVRILGDYTDAAVFDLAP